MIAILKIIIVVCTLNNIMVNFALRLCAIKKSNYIYIILVKFGVIIYIMKNGLLWLLGAGAVYWLVNRTVRAAYNLSYSVAGFSFANSYQGNFLVNVRIINSSSAAIPLLGAIIGGNITVNNSIFLGTARGQLDMVLPSNAELIVPVFLNVSPDYMSGGVVALMSLVNKAGFELNFNGALTVAGVSQPVQINYKLL